MIRKITTGLAEVAKSSGFVYVLTYTYPAMEKGERVVVKLTKIGVSREPERRFSEIKGDLPHPENLRTNSVWAVWYPAQVESKLHKRFWDKKSRPPGAGPKAGADEYFKLGGTDKLTIYITLVKATGKYAAFWFGVFALLPLLFFAFVPAGREIWVEIVKFIIS